MIYRRVEIMSDVESAFLAGLTEGDGCIYMRPNSRIEGSYFLGFHITSVDKPLIDFVYSITGVGHIRINDKHLDGRKTSWRWDVTSHKDVLGLLKRMYPYLVIKKRRAELVYQMGILLSLNRGSKMTQVEVNRRLPIYEEFKSLQTHQPIVNGGEFGGTLEQTIPSQAPVGEGVEVSPEIKDTSAAPEMEDMTRAAEESVEAEQR